jgi:hypothetical protein
MAYSSNLNLWQTQMIATQKPRASRTKVIVRDKVHEELFTIVRIHIIRTGIRNGPVAVTVDGGRLTVNACPSQSG